MKNIYNYFNNNGKDSYPNHLKKFQELGFTPANPIIFILDNELSNKEKPLKNLTNHIKLDKDTAKKRFF
ncbi:hypothetical protein ACUIJ5_30780 (plasmid) [Bacillus toyonensis]